MFTSSFPWQPENGDMTVSSIIVSHRQLSSRCHAVSRTEKLSWENDDKWRGKTNISLAVTCSLIRAAVSFVTVIVTRHTSSVTNTWHKVKYVMETQPSVETNLFFGRIRISNLIRNPEFFRIRIRILFVVRKFSNPNPNIRGSGKKIRIWIRIWRNFLIIQIIE